MNVVGPIRPGYSEILTDEALRFIERLVRAFRGEVDTLLARRQERQAAWDAGAPLGFLADMAHVRAEPWMVAPPPPDLEDRRVEITGPVDRKMVVNALNSGASVFMADFEDANSPTWDNVIQGQLNLRDANRRALDFEQGGKRYTLQPRIATLMVRPRGWHLPEAHVLVDGRPVPAALFDAGLYAFHNARQAALYLYLPKMQAWTEAELWNRVLRHIEYALGLSRGEIRVTCLVETLPAAFQMEEILWALRERSVGLNCGRWDYIFSTIKTMRARPEWVLPDRGQVTMTQPFLRAYTQLLVDTCHRRGAHAMGGMAADIPIKGDEVANEAALARVRADKLREVGDGHDGTWVAHPALVPIAKAVFDEHMPAHNQLDKRPTANVEDLLRPPTGTRTWAGVCLNVDVGVRYLEAWLRGNGCVPLHHKMEDAATAEISRAQLWQQVRHGASIEGNGVVDLALVESAIADCHFPDSGRFPEALALFRSMVGAPSCPDFLTLPAYQTLLTLE